jgi:hypothetical protein
VNDLEDWNPEAEAREAEIRGEFLHTILHRIPPPFKSFLSPFQGFLRMLKRSLARLEATNAARPEEEEWPGLEAVEDCDPEVEDAFLKAVLGEFLYTILHRIPPLLEVLPPF